MYCDNQLAIRLLKSGVDSPKGRHIDVHYHYIQDVVEKEEVTVDFLPSTDMIVVKGNKCGVIFKACKLDGT